MDIRRFWVARASTVAQRVEHVTNLASQVLVGLSLIALLSVALWRGDRNLTITFLLALALVVLTSLLPGRRLAFLPILLALWITYLAALPGIGSPKIFIPVTLLGFMVALVPTFLLEALPATIVLLGTVSYEAWVVLNPTPGMNLVASLIHGFPIISLYHLAFGLGFIVTRREAIANAHLIDEQERESRELNEKAVILDAIRLDRQSMLQRLHETVLNTLGVIIRSTDASIPGISERCGADLEVLDEWQRSDLPHDIQEIVDEAIQQVPTDRFEVKVFPGKVITLSDDISRRIGAILQELVANSVRHSNGNLIQISWRVIEETKIELVVRDNGIGFIQENSERLGLRVIVRENVDALHGQLILKSEKGIGTTVTIRVRLEADERAIARAHPSVVGTPINTSLLAARGVFIFLLVAAPLLAQDSHYRNWLFILLVSTALFHLAFVTKRKMPRLWLQILGVTLAEGSLWCAWAGSDTFVSAKPIQWIANVAIISGLLLASSRQGLARWVLLLLSYLPPFILWNLTSDPEVQQLLKLPLLSGLICAPILFLATVLARQQNSEVQTRGETIRLAVLAESERAKLAISRLERWNSAVRNARELMTEVKNGISVDDAIRQRAEVADSQLRAHLQIDPDEDGSFARLALELSEACSRRGKVLHIVVNEVSKSFEPIPYEVDNFLRALVNEMDSQGRLRIITLEDQEIMSLTSSLSGEYKSLQMYQDQLKISALSEWLYRDTTLSIEFLSQGEIPEIWINISRPIKRIV